MKKYKNIIFDVGNVLFRYRWADMLIDYGMDPAAAQSFGKMLFEDSADLWKIYDMGTMSDEALTEVYVERYPQAEKELRWFFAHGEYLHIALHRAWDALHQLKAAGYRIYLLSNYAESLFRKHTEYADFMKDLDGMMVSYMVNSAKPDREIYDALYKKYSLDPAECLFFDDRAENVEASRATGMDAFQVTSEDDLIRFIHENLL